MNTSLIARYLAEECNSIEEEKFEQWLQSDSSNKELMEEFKRIWKASGEKNKAFDQFFDPAEDWEVLRNRIMREHKQKGDESDLSAFPPSKNKRATASKTFFTQFMRVAAIVIFGSLLGILAYQNLYHSPEVAEPVLREISMERGQRGNITLSDGTKVTLNAESKIVLPDVFKPDKREITLEGEAFFDVTHNPDRPFIINTDKAVVRVLGTSLDVRSYPDDKTIQVVVKEGRVSLKPKTECADGDTVLTAGELGQLSISDNRIIKKKVDDLDLFLSWTKGYLKFKDTPMSKVAEELERKYDVQIAFSNEKLKNLRLTAELKSRAIQHNMDVISTSLSMKYKMDQQVITFYRE